MHRTPALFSLASLRSGEDCLRGGMKFYFEIAIIRWCSVWIDRFWLVELVCFFSCYWGKPVFCWFG